MILENFVLANYIYSSKINNIPLIRCTTVGDTSDSRYLTYDLYYKCFSKEHLNVAYVLALPSMLFWGIGIPIFAWKILNKNRERLDDPEV